MTIRSAALNLVGLVAVAAAIGCGGPNTAAERQMDQFRRDIARVQADNERLNERVTALEAGQSQPAAERPKKDSQGGPPKLQVVKLVPGQDQEETGAEGDKPAESTEGEEPTVIRAEGSKTQVTRPGSKEKAKESPRSAQATRDYEAALGLIKRKQYDRALEAFGGFLVHYPDDPNADNAMYWRGECFYSKGEYARAAEEFAAVAARFPEGNKVPDALLKVGLSHLKAGAKDKAKEAFARLRRDFPSSEASRKIPRE